METQPPLRDDYETPTVTDHGDLAELTAASQFSGVFDSDYHAGDPIPSGGVGSAP
jgi:hypothetical protein